MEPVADAILIEELELAVRIGVPEGERARPQRLTVSITMWPRRGFQEMADRLEETINYSEIARAVKGFVEPRRDKLIETLADAIASHLLDSFALQRVRIELRKFVLPDAKFVAVVCERGRHVPN